ncbi:MAG: ydjP 1 [Alphaproteobacteria bacterium]|jgi:pimeloyl-ACP methyl ester carboxylesterase|nr:ydjP 1 [Alphaproteobacteria bacterium]
MPEILCNGISLNYFIKGTGKQSFILIHNAGGNLHFMKHPFHHLSQKGRVINVDLRGHGESDKPKTHYAASIYAEDLLSLCQKLTIKEATVVGLNYGGVIAVELANMNPGLVSKLVLIDPPLLMESWVKQLIQNHIEELQDPDMKNFSQQLVESVMVKAAKEDKLMAIKAFDMISRPALISTYRDLLEWDGASHDKIQNCTMPILNIQSSHPFCSEPSLRNLCPHLTTGKVVNSGPWATLEVPSQVNAMIDRFLNL